jgi:hypothetical protein
MERNKWKRVKNPPHKPAEMYDVNAYGRAIARACEKAFPLSAARRRVR